MMRRHFSKILLADIVDSLKVAPALYMSGLAR